MSGSEKITSINQLFTLKPTELQSWLDAVWSKSESVPKEFNWLGLADYAAHNANYHDDIEWAKTGIRIYDWLHTQNPNSGYDRQSMNLRASFIGKRGHISGDLLLDLDVILEWLWGSLPMSLTEARLAIPKCRETLAQGTITGPGDLELCRKLRQIKNNLNVIAWLVEDGVFVPDDDLNAWIKLKPDLP